MYSRLICNKPPVRNPEAIELKGSSLPRIATNVQSQTENIPPHMAKPPPVIAAFCLTVDKDS